MPSIGFKMLWLLLSSVRGAALVVLYPEALNQHPFGPIDFVKNLGFSILIGLWAYACAFSSFWFHGLIFKRRSFRTIHRSSIPIGVAVAVITQIEYLPRVLPENVGGVIKAGLMIVILLSAIVVAFRTFWDGDSTSTASLQ
jgi:hypothetical protein